MAAVLWLCVLAAADVSSYQPNITDGDVLQKLKYPIEEMVKWIETMRWESVAVIFDGKSATIGSLAKTLTSSLPTTTTMIYDFISVGVQTLLHVLYHNLQPNINTVLLCEESRTCWRFLDEAARYDLKSNRTTDFRHQSKWIVLGHEDTRNGTFNHSGYLENVAFFQSKARL
ncbi:uncharacterized protein LOC124267255 [Haliotis rubra]|uniref:uncharacterized protein LOC124267255 n=1 Tax=Haliotis rubra TaxID=36100 RepID=UPI001EE5F80F|nr:uncharacterized protein LOC124267255 [Haliotis rubra]